MPKYDSAALWTVIREFGEDNLFHVYPAVLNELLVRDDAARAEADAAGEAERLVLPSDREWRTHQYFLLVSLQKTLETEPQVSGTDEGSTGSASARPAPAEEPEEWAPWSVVVQYRSPSAPPPVAVKAAPGPAWDIGQALKAARLLSKPPAQVEFVDEPEMRCVYSLIYDVFRYKNILDQAIDDIDFFSSYPHHKVHRQTVWLFLMELARRRWGARARGEGERAARLLRGAGAPYREIEAAVWEQRVHFAAAVARIRIKNKAFSLSELLPPHLREERGTGARGCASKETVTGWVNTFKSKNVASLVKCLHALGYSYSGSRQLCAGEYRFDRVCPRFITLRPPADASVGQMDLVRNGVIVLQEREFCEGASTLCRALRAHSLAGVVAQSHASSPRCSAYLAAQLRELAAVLRAKAPAAPATPELGRLVVFGAGDKVESYVCALRELGVEASEAPQSGAPVCVLSEPVHGDAPAVASALDGVVAVLATPPNSYSAVSDPIDLVCGRGGDLAMLEVLTEAEVDNVGKARVQSILEEQKRTLKTLLSKPQIQLVLYETHSALEAENQMQITRAVAEANRVARERHALLRRKHRDHPSAALKIKAITETVSETSIENTVSRSDISRDGQLEDVLADDRSQKADSPSAPATNGARPPSATVLKKQAESSTTESRPGTTKAKPIPEIQIPESAPTPRDPDKDSSHVHVPNCDLFEIGRLPTLGNGLDINYILDRDGCFLGLIQRKEITRLDAKYMIKVAEERGLFGAGAPAPAGPQRRQRAAAAAGPRRRRRTGGFEIERVAAPTYASLVRSTRRGSAPAAAGAAAPPCVSLAPAGEAHVCERHARRQAAANAFSAACTCDARHRHQIRQRRASAEGGGADVPPAPAPPCRRPFPLVVHDLRLRTGVAHPSRQNKLIA